MHSAVSALLLSVSPCSGGLRRWRWHHRQRDEPHDGRYRVLGDCRGHPHTGHQHLRLPHLQVSEISAINNVHCRKQLCWKRI